MARLILFKAIATGCRPVKHLWFLNIGRFRFRRDGEYHIYNVALGSTGYSIEQWHYIAQLLAKDDFRLQ
jgi:hypothetical protein